MTNLQNEQINNVAMLVIRYIDNELLAKYYQENIKLSIEIIENHVFLYSDIGNTRNIIKKQLNIDVDEISLLYEKLYNLFKLNYVESPNIKISLLKITNLSNINNPYLLFKIRDVHRNEINIFIRNFNYEKNVLNNIEKDWINLIEEKKSNRKK